MDCCENCGHYMPRIPGINTLPSTCAPGFRTWVSHICNIGPNERLWRYFASISFVTCRNGPDYAAQIWDDDSLWTEIVAEPANGKPHILCDGCNAPTSDFVFLGGEYLCRVCC